MSGPETSAGWRRLHPLTPVLSLFRGSYLFLLIVAFAGPMIGSRTSAPLGAVAALAAVLVLLKYLRFRYCVTGSSIIITEGILFRRRRVIPRSRIQHIDLKAGLLQQLLGVVQARIETAGGQDAEAALIFVSREEGQRLRAGLVTRTTQEEAALDPIPLRPDFERHIGVTELAIAGATSNRAGVIVGLLFGGNAIFDIIPTDWLLRRLVPAQYLQTDAAVKALVESAQSDFRTFILGAASLALAFGLLGWGASILLSILRYFEFTLAAGAGEIRMSYGLLTRRETSFRKSRVQNIQIEEPILRRWLGLASLRVQTAGYGAGVQSDEKVETLAPIARSAEIPRYVATIFPELDLAAVEWRPSHPKARRRLFLRRALFVIGLSAGAAFLIHEGAVLFLLAGLFFAWIMAGLHYRHLGHAPMGAFILTREGFWTRRTYIVPVRKIQAIHLRETPFQRRLGLATLTIETAGSPYEWHAPRSIDLGKHYGLELMGSLAGDVNATGLNF